MADTLKKRARLYMHYKLNEVGTEEIIRSSELNAEDNYKRLCGIRIRLTHCLSARQTVHELYGDGDKGHAEAIAYVASQINSTDLLLQENCDEMIRNAPVTQEVEDKDEPTAAQEKTDCKKKNRRRRRRNVKARVEDICQKLRAESEMLETFAKQALDKFCSILTRMVDIAMDDADISYDMRCLVNDTFKRNGYETLMMFASITRLVVYEDPRFICTDGLQTGRALQSYFYYIDVTDETLKCAIVKFQEKYLVKKSRMVESLGEATSADRIYIDLIQKLSVKLFAHLYSLTGSYTTHRSLSTVVILAGAVSKMTSMRSELCQASNDALRRRYLARKHGEAYVKNVEDATHVMLDMCCEEDPWHPKLLPWSYFLNAKDFYVATAQAYAPYILKQAPPQLFDITKL